MRLSFSSALMCDNKPVVSVLSNTSAGAETTIFFSARRARRRKLSQAYCVSASLQGMSESRHHLEMPSLSWPMAEAKQGAEVPGSSKHLEHTDYFDRITLHGSSNTLPLQRLQTLSY